MSVERFLVVLKLARIHEDDGVWFGRWLRRYAVFLRQPESASLLVSQASVGTSSWCSSWGHSTLQLMGTQHFADRPI